MILNSDGSLDESFGDNGIWRVSRDDMNVSAIRKITVDDSNNLIIAGDTNFDLVNGYRMFVMGYFL